MKFNQITTCYGSNIDWADIPHGTKLMKVTLTDSIENDHISINNEMLPRIRIEALVAENGTMYIVEEAVEPRKKLTTES